MKKLSNTRKEAREKLENLKKEVESLEKVLNSPASLFTDIDNISDVYAELGEEEVSAADFDFLPKGTREEQLAFAHVKALERLFNGKWIPNWKDTNEQKWYPYFRDTGSGLVFGFSYYCYWGYCDSVAYFKDKATSDFIGTKFLYLFKILAKAK